MPPTTEDAKIHLEVLGQEREIHCRARVGKTRLKEILPLARSLCGAITEIAAEEAQRQGKEVSCKKGCDFCCRQLIPIAPMEAKRLAEIVQAMPKKRADALRRKFEGAKAKLVTAGLLPARARKGQAAFVSAETDAQKAWDEISHRYYALHIDCPFLEDGACTIYEERPLACREYNAVSDPSYCETLDPRLETTPRPIRFGEVLTRLGNALSNSQFAGIPLVLALEWAEVHGTSQERVLDGEAMFWAFVEMLEASSDE